jgi:hypothetical protein
MICKAFENLVGNDVALELHGNTYEDVVWLDERAKPSKSVWQAEYDTLVAAIPLNEVRAVRNRLLAETDWLVTMHKELGTDIPTKIKTYRQKLRDITDSASSLDNVTWPTLEA